MTVRSYFGEAHATCLSRLTCLSVGQLLAFGGVSLQLASILVAQQCTRGGLPAETLSLAERNQKTSVSIVKTHWVLLCILRIHVDASGNREDFSSRTRKSIIHDLAWACICNYVKKKKKLHNIFFLSEFLNAIYAMFYLFSSILKHYVYFFVTRCYLLMLLKQFLFKNSFTTFLCWIDQSIIFLFACPVYSLYNVNKLQQKK